MKYVILLTDHPGCGKTTIYQPDTIKVKCKNLRSDLLIPYSAVHRNDPQLENIVGI